MAHPDCVGDGDNDVVGRLEAEEVELLTELTVWVVDGVPVLEGVDVDVGVPVPVGVPVGVKEAVYVYVFEAVPVPLLDSVYVYVVEGVTEIDGVHEITSVTGA